MNVKMILAILAVNSIAMLKPICANAELVYPSTDPKLSTHIRENVSVTIEGKNTKVVFGERLCLIESDSSVYVVDISAKTGLKMSKSSPDAIGDYSIHVRNRIFPLWPDWCGIAQSPNEVKSRLNKELSAGSYDLKRAPFEFKALPGEFEFVAYNDPETEYAGRVEWVLLSGRSPSRVPLAASWAYKYRGSADMRKLSYLGPFGVSSKGVELEAVLEHVKLQAIVDGKIAGNPLDDFKVPGSHLAWLESRFARNIGRKD